MDRPGFKWRADKNFKPSMVHLHKAVKPKKPMRIVSVSPNYYDFGYKLQLQGLARLGGGATISSMKWIRGKLYRPDVASFATEVARPNSRKPERRIPTEIGSDDGATHQAAPMQLIQAQVARRSAERNGVAFFYFESLWNATPPKRRFCASASFLPFPPRNCAVRRLLTSTPNHAKNVEILVRLVGARRECSEFQHQNGVPLGWP